MEFVIEVLMEFLLEGSISISSNKKYPKIIRYPLLFFVFLFFGSVFFLLFWFGIMLLKENVYGGIFILLVALLLFIGAFLKFKKIYLRKKEKLENVSESKDL